VSTVAVAVTPSLPTVALLVPEKVSQLPTEPE
jgi:hypothetical protein